MKVMEFESFEKFEQCENKQDYEKEWLAMEVDK